MHFEFESTQTISIGEEYKQPNGEHPATEKQSRISYHSSQENSTTHENLSDWKGSAHNWQILPIRLSQIVQIKGNMNGKKKKKTVVIPSN